LTNPAAIERPETDALTSFHARMSHNAVEKQAMQQESIQTHLSDLPLGPILYFDKVGSTNDVAAAWAKRGAPHLALVIADEQTAGRGRGQRKWFTPPESALAFSLILRPHVEQITRVAGLGALGVCQALRQRYQLPAEIKWPNDVLVHGAKVAGVLTESSWVGNRLSALILGIGVNVAASAVPPDDWPGHDVHPFPATSLESELGETISRLDLLHDVLNAILSWLPTLDSGEFLQVWEDALAFRGQHVWILPGDETGRTEPFQGRLLGLDTDGSLRLEAPSGEEIVVQTGDVHLRPVDSFGK
jgi:BirA family biotin operon repressor/biotin-[acetyl-CoA-carboxylase] ligase